MERDAKMRHIKEAIIALTERKQRASSILRIRESRSKETFYNQ